MKFKVGTSELFSGDVALTFIAGYRQTLSIPFCFAGMQLPPAPPCFRLVGSAPTLLPGNRQARIA